MGLYGGHYYELVVGNWISNEEAKDISAQRLYRNVFGHLLTVNSAGEQSFIASWVKNAVLGGRSELNVSWIDGARIGSTATFAYTVGPQALVGQALQYTSWDVSSPINGNARQPDAASSGLDCLVMYYVSGNWSDDSCGSLASYIVEYECPGNVSLFNASSGCCAGFRGPTCAIAIPNSASVLKCVGSTPVRANSLISCTITSKSATNAVTVGLSTDFSAGASAGATITSLVTSNGGSTFTFSATPLAIAPNGFNVIVQAQGVTIVNGSSAFVVYGTPTSASSLMCHPVPPLRYHSPIRCTITVSDNAGATTGIASDFVISSTSSASISPSSSDGGFTYEFTTTPLTFTSAFTISATVQGTAIDGSGVSFVIYGIPTAASSISCSAMSPLRITETVACTVSASDALGAITAVTSDFVASSPSSDVISMMSQGDGSIFTFETTPVDPTLSFLIDVAIGESSISQSFIAYGYPDNTSYITCVSSEARVAGPLISCVLTAREEGVATLALASDFPEIFFDGIPATPEFVAVDGGWTFDFDALLPEVYNDHYEVRVNVMEMWNISLWYPVYAASTGPASNKSVTVCTYGGRVNSVLLCNVSFVSSEGNATSVSIDDITVLTNPRGPVPERRRTNGEAASIVALNGGVVYAIEVATPAVATVGFNVSIYVNAHLVTSTALEVFGVPTNESHLACAGVHSAAGFVHVLENVTCTITVEDANGPTAALPSDFNITVNNAEANVTSTISTSDHGFSYTFVVMSPFTSSPAFHVGAALVDGPAINGSVANLTVICLLNILVIVTMKLICNAA